MPRIPACHCLANFSLYPHPALCIHPVTTTNHLQSNGRDASRVSRPNGIYILRRCPPERGSANSPHSPTQNHTPPLHHAVTQSISSTARAVNRVCVCMNDPHLSVVSSLPTPTQPTYLPLSVLHPVFHTELTTNYTPITVIFYTKRGALHTLVHTQKTDNHIILLLLNTRD